MREAREVFSAAVEAELPYINVAVAALSAEPFTLTIAFDCGVKTVRENSFGLIVSAWSFREVGDLSGREIWDTAFDELERMIAAAESEA